MLCFSPGHEEGVRLPPLLPLDHETLSGPGNTEKEKEGDRGPGAIPSVASCSAVLRFFYLHLPSFFKKCGIVFYWLLLS